MQLHRRNAPPLLLEKITWCLIRHTNLQQKDVIFRSQMSQKLTRLMGMKPRNAMGSAIIAISYATYIVHYSRV